jgi:hypothetical protein
MSRKFVVVLVAGFMLVAVLAATSQAGVFVATAKNARGALYTGFGPTPNHACEMAIVKCSQDSFIPPSCKVMAVRLDCPPPMCAPPRKVARNMSKVYPPVYPMGRPMP